MHRTSPGLGSRRLIAVAAVAVLLGTCASASGGGPGAPAALSPSGGTSIGGLSWIQDKRITTSQLADTQPILFLTGDSTARVFWNANRTTDTGWHYAQLDAKGDFLRQDTFVSSHYVAGWGPTYPLAPAIGVDSAGNIHVVFEDGFTNISYEKFDADGNGLIAARHVNPANGASPHGPSLAIAGDDSVHIAHEDYRFNCEDVLYEKLDNNGGGLWNSRVVNADVYAHNEFSLIKADRNSGSSLFTFGSNYGTWLTRFNKFGVKDMSSVLLQTSLRHWVIDVAATRDGMIHVAWATGGTVYYSRVNSSGGREVDALVLSNGTAAPYAFPRLAPLENGSVAVVWDDLRTGSSQIRLAIVDPTTDANSTVKNFQLTDSPSGASRPSVAVGADGSVHVAWVDSRDGNSEIYYKRSYSCGAQLHMDPMEIGNQGLFAHPNQSLNETVHLRNKGLWADSFQLELAADPSALSRGWSVALDPLVVTDLEAGASRDLELRVQTPRDALHGDYVSISIVATSQCDPAASDEISLSFYVMVSRSLRVFAGTPTKVGDNGETVSFNLVVANRGDVPEAGVSIAVAPQTIPSGWAAWTEPSNFSLEPGESAAFTVWVTVAADAPGGMVAQIGVSATSTADPSVRALVKLTVLVKSTLGLNLTANPNEQEALPGALVHFPVRMEGWGNLASPVRYDIALQGSPPPGWVAALSTESVSLLVGSPREVVVTIGVPAAARAGTNASWTLVASSGSFGINQSLVLGVVVGHACGVAVNSYRSAASTKAGPVEFPIAVVNNGNDAELLAVAEWGLPEGWAAALLTSAGPVTSMEIGATSILNATVRATPAAHPHAGMYTVTLSLYSVVCGQAMANFSVEVNPTYGAEMAAIISAATAEPGGRASYELTLRNTGNRLITSELSVEDLGRNFETRFFISSPGGLRPLYPGEVFDLEPGIALAVRLEVEVPLNVSMDRLDFGARAVTGAGDAPLATLRLDVHFADLVVRTPAVAPESPRPTQLCTIEVPVANMGNAQARNVRVEMYQGGRLLGVRTVGTLDPGESKFAQFTWTAGEGANELRLVTYLGLDQPELVVENNQVTILVDAGYAGAGANTPSPSVGAAVASLAIAALVWTILRRRRT